MVFSFYPTKRGFSIDINGFDQNFVCLNNPTQKKSRRVDGNDEVRKWQLQSGGGFCILMPASQRLVRSRPFASRIRRSSWLFRDQSALRA